VPKPLFIARQGRRPSGLLGRIVAHIMARETAMENDAAIELLQLQPADVVLEIGSGHGGTLAKAAQVASEGQLCGIDFSEVMHRHALSRHRRLVDAGRVTFHLGDSTKLPFPDHAFDRTYSVHTIYFWERPLEHLREARRTLKPSGTLLLGFRPGEDAKFGATFPSAVYHIRPEAEVVDLVKSAGFGIAGIERKTFGGRQVSFVLGTDRS